MTMVVGMRELARNSNILDGYDYVDVVDKMSKEIQEQLGEIEQFAGSIHIEERFVNLTDKEIREKIGQEKYGQ